MHTAADVFFSSACAALADRPLNGSVDLFVGSTEYTVISIIRAQARSMKRENIFPDYSAKAIRIRRSVLDAIERYALREYPNMALGMISGNGQGDFRTVYPIRNVADDPTRAYEGEPESLFRVQGEMRKHEAKLTALYNSRNDARAFFSVTQQNLDYYEAPKIVVAIDGSKINEVAIYSLNKTTQLYEGRLVVPVKDLTRLVAIRTLSDKPIEDVSEDLLGFHDYAAALADFIRNRGTSTPFAVGIEGKWGSGKTSLMNLLRSRLEAYGLVTATFNAWRYEKREELIAALASSVMDQITSRWSWLDRLRFADTLAMRRLDRRYVHSLSIDIRLWLVIVVILMLITLAIIQLSPRSILALVPAVASIASLLWLLLSVARNSFNPFRVRLSSLIRDPKYREQAGFLELFREDFAEVVQLIQKFENKRRQRKFRHGIPRPPNEEEGEPGRLVIFIDDLDRCAPESICEVLQAINLTLGCIGVVFVLGMDMHIIEAAIEVRYSAIADRIARSEPFHNLFLEKILQLRFKVPSRRSRITYYFEKLLNQEAITSISPMWSAPQESDSYRRYIQQVTDVAGRIEEAAQDLDGIGAAMTSLAGDWVGIAPDVLMEARRKAFNDIFNEDSAIVREAFDEVSNYLEGNPRTIKRFLNLFRLKAIIGESHGLFESGITYNLLARWVLLSARWPHVCRWCEENPELLSDLSSAPLQIDPKCKQYIEEWPAPDRKAEAVTKLCEC